MVFDKKIALFDPTSKHRRDGLKTPYRIIYVHTVYLSMVNVHAKI